MDVSYFAEQDPKFALQFQVPSWKEIDVRSRCLETRIRVGARCTDLLEFTDDDKVQFLHRTVKDFLETKNMQLLLNERAGEDFNAHVYLCNSAIGQVKTFVRKPRDVSPWQNLDVLLHNFMHHAHHLEIQSHLDYSLVTELEQAIGPLRATSISNNGIDNTTLPSFHAFPRLEYGIRDGWLGDLALKEGIRGYEAIEAENLVNDIKQGRWAFSRPPLDILLLSTPTSRVQAEAIKRLLDEGADPNERTLQKSAWKIYLTALQKSQILSKSEDSTFRVIQLLLEYGADPSFDGHGDFFLDLMLTQFSFQAATSLEELRLKCKIQLKRSKFGDQRGEETPRVNACSQAEAAPVQKQKESQRRFSRLTPWRRK